MNHAVLGCGFGNVINPFGGQLQGALEIGVINLAGVVTSMVVVAVAVTAAKLR